MIGQLFWSRCLADFFQVSGSPTAIIMTIAVAPVDLAGHHVNAWDIEGSCFGGGVGNRDVIDPFRNEALDAANRVLAMRIVEGHVRPDRAI